MKVRLSHILIASAVVLIGLYYYNFIFRVGDVFLPHSKNAPNREALIRLRDSIQLDDDYSAALSAYWQQRTDSLKLHVDSRDHWYVSTPVEFADTKWGLRIEFRAGRVSALRVRTADGPPPKDGPPDKHKPDA